MKNNLEKIGSLWVGDKLSNLEILSIKSFILNGHPYHLHVYNDIENIPEGVILEDANKIVPEKDIFYAPGSNGRPGSLGAFSDYFRFKMMQETGGYWVDTDIVCIRPFDFKDPYVFASENTHRGEQEATSGIQKFPKDCDAVKYCVEYCDSFEDKNNIRWGDIGPSLVRNAIKKYDLQKYIKDYKIFMPVNWWESNEFFNPNPTFQITPDTYSIHLWNDVWSSNGVDKNGDFHPNSIYEQLKKWVNI
tara:strand:- start:3 stop:743 length:741 start_codon:yes stop_codon:yes gene_type:complete